MTELMTQQTLKTDNNPSWHRIWQISWPVMLSNLTLPLVGAVDVAMMGHLPDPALIGGVALGALIFNFVFLFFSFLRMSTTGFTAQAHGRIATLEIQKILILGMVIGASGGVLIIALYPLIAWAAPLLFQADTAVEIHMMRYINVRIFGAPAVLMNFALLGWLFGLQAMRVCMFQLLI